MERNADKIDSINVLLEACIEAYPVSPFVISLYQQYVRRGSLSKKQLQGLYDKASRIKDLPPGKLAAVEAIIKRMPTRTKSAIPPNKPLYEKNADTAVLLDSILSKLPDHKRALFLKTKYENNEPLSQEELTGLKKIKELLDKR